jgi:anaerobic ribonucleoside-triphosphate reductase
MTAYRPTAQFNPAPSYRYGQPSSISYGYGGGSLGHSSYSNLAGLYDQTSYDSQYLRILKDLNRGEQNNFYNGYTPYNPYLSSSVPYIRPNPVLSRPFLTLNSDYNADSNKLDELDLEFARLDAVTYAPVRKELNSDKFIDNVRNNNHQNRRPPPPHQTVPSLPPSHAGGQNQPRGFPNNNSINKSRPPRTSHGNKDDLLPVILAPRLNENNFAFNKPKTPMSKLNLQDEEQAMRPMARRAQPTQQQHQQQLPLKSHRDHDKENFSLSSKRDGGSGGGGDDETSNYDYLNLRNTHDCENDGHYYYINSDGRLTKSKSLINKIDIEEPYKKVASNRKVHEYLYLLSKNEQGSFIILNI